MNNKITIYELLGLVKDGQAPKYIDYFYNELWHRFKWNGHDYDCVNTNCFNKLIRDIFNINILDDEVEILDNEDEDIEEIDFKTAETQKEKNRIMKDKINELVKEVSKLKKIDCFKSKGE